MTTQLELALSARDEALSAHETSLPGSWLEDACNAALRVLRRIGPATGEEVVDRLKGEGWAVRDDRAFGAVFGRLSRDGQIQRGGYARRLKGHGTAGAIVWRAA